MYDDLKTNEEITEKWFEIVIKLLSCVLDCLMNFYYFLMSKQTSVWIIFHLNKSKCKDSHGAKIYNVNTFLIKTVILEK